MGAFRAAGLAVVGLVLVVVVGAAGVYVLSEMRLNQRLSASQAQIAIPNDISGIRRGQHLVGAIALCTMCHGANLGGMLLQDDRSGRVVAPNLTSGGVAGTRNGQDLLRAIRDGIDPVGRPLWLMPADDYNQLSDADAAAIVAYLESLPPTATSLPPAEMRPLGRVMLVIGKWALLPEANIDRLEPRPPPPQPGLSVEYGAYLATIARCSTCHVSLPLRNWSDTDFLRTMRTGRLPDNRPLDPAMPWPYFAQMSDLELQAIWEYVGFTSGGAS